MRLHNPGEDYRVDRARLTPDLITLRNDHVLSFRL